MGGAGRSSPGSFYKLSEKDVLRKWGADQEAVDAAHSQAVEAAQFLIHFLVEKELDTNGPLPMIRLDFMVKHLGNGKAQVVFGEFCEMGACCLKWEEGPPRIWRAALDYALRGGATSMNTE